MDTQADNRNTTQPSTSHTKRSNTERAKSDDTIQPPPPKFNRTRSKTGGTLQWSKEINPDNPLS